MVRGIDIFKIYVEDKIKINNFEIDTAKDSLAMSMWVAASCLTILGFTIIYSDKINGFIASNYPWTSQAIFWLCQLLLFISIIISGSVFTKTNVVINLLRRQNTIEITRLKSFLRNKENYELGTDKRPTNLNLTDNEEFVKELIYILDSDGYKNPLILLTALSEWHDIKNGIEDSSKLIRYQKVITIISVVLIILLSIKLPPDPPKRDNTAHNKSVAYSGAGRWSNQQHTTIIFCSNGKNSFEYQNKFFIFE